MATRTHARVAVVELLYAYSSGNDDIRKFATNILSEKKIRNTQATFALGLFDGVMENLCFVDETIKQFLQSWEFERLGVVDKCIVRLGTYEMLYSDLDTPIIINEAIEISKILGSENTSRFVNGILDTISKKSRNLVSKMPDSTNSQKEKS